MATPGFSLSDLGRVNWGPTAKLALGRGVASSLVIAFLALLAGQFRGLGLGAPFRFFFMLIFGLAVGAPINFLMIKGISAIVERVGLGIGVLACNLMLYMIAIAVAIGDPIVFFVNRQVPHLLEVADFKPFNFIPAIFVLSDAESKHG